MNKGIKQYEKLYNSDNFEELNSNIKSITEDVIYVKSFYVQTLPGVIMILNNEPIEIGNTGVYQMEQKNNFILNNFKITDNSIELIKGDVDAYFLINFIYEEG